MMTWRLAEANAIWSPMVGVGHRVDGEEVRRVVDGEAMGSMVLRPPRGLPRVAAVRFDRGSTIGVRWQGLDAEWTRRRLNGGDEIWSLV